jgi:hypothetical protein
MLIPILIVLVTAYFLHELYIIIRKLSAFQLSSSWIKIGTIILAFALAAVSGMMVYQSTFEIFAASMLLVPSQGTIKTAGLDFGVYWDITGTQPVTSVDWGTLSPGDHKTVTFWVKNQAAIPIYCGAQPDSGTWQPATASNYLTLSWTFGTKSLGVSMLRRINMTLTVSPTIKDITIFSFTIIVNAQETPLS